MAAYDGVPGDPENPRGTHIILKSKDGVFYGAEAGLNSAEKEEHYKLGVGSWYRTTDFENDAGRQFNNNSGLYSIGELMVLAEDDIEQGLGAFYQLGFTHSDRNRFANYIGAGVNYTGLFPGRDGDALVMAMARAQNGQEFREATPDSTRTETILELTYRLKIFDYLSMQPDFQYVINPNTDANLGHAAVVGMRMEVDL
jgi:porin